MEFKKLKVAEKNLKSTIEYQSNFGWVLDSQEKKMVVLTRNIDKKYANKLNKIDKEIKKARKLFPFGEILYLLIAAGVALFWYKFFPNFDYSFLDSLEEAKPIVLKIAGYALLAIAGLFALIGLIQMVIFIIRKATKKKSIEQKLSLAREITGQYCKVPLKSCIKEPGTTSNILAKMNL